MEILIVSETPPITQELKNVFKTYEQSNEAVIDLNAETSFNPGYFDPMIKDGHVVPSMDHEKLFVTKETGINAELLRTPEQTFREIAAVGIALGAARNHAITSSSDYGLAA